jgi:ABC-type transporter Mla MlaB component
MAPRTVSLAIRGPLARSDLPGLYSRVCQLLHAGDPALVLCDVGGVAADAVAVEALARLALGARRSGCQVRLRNAPADLREIVALLGLAEVLRVESVEP